MPPPDGRSDAEWIACAPKAVREKFLKDLETEMPDVFRVLPYLFEFWAMPHQRPPEGDWRSWVILGGRGAGKTRAGSEWVRSMVEGPNPTDPGKARNVALVSETLEQAREVMVFGDSGILACSPPDRKPLWHATRRMLEWPNGATAHLYSGHDPERLRGPQFDAAWVDELAKWPKAEEAWEMLQLALRLGEHPQQVITTTPRSVGVLKDIMSEPSTVTTHAPTDANRANLAASFLVEVRRRYAGSRLERQELDGEFLDEAEGALWPLLLLEQSRIKEVPQLSRVIVAVDPPVTSTKSSDECGIIVAGAVTEGSPSDWYAVVLEDASVRGYSPNQWGQVALDALRRHGGERLIAEVNQGGDLVEEVLRSLDPTMPYRAVRASRGKAARAEPIAALYEQGRVRHVAGLKALEDQLALMTVRGFQGKGSPDRVDALVWAMHELLINPARDFLRPQIRSL